MDGDSEHGNTHGSNLVIMVVDRLSFLCITVRKPARVPGSQNEAQIPGRPVRPPPPPHLCTEHRSRETV